MAVNEVAALTGTIITIASTIQKLGDSWYRASNEWDDFPRKVELLSKKHNLWVAQLAKFGMLSDPEAKPFIDTLGTAEQLLKAEPDKLLKRQEKGKRSWGTGCWAKSSMMMFPAQLGLSIGRVITAFDDIQALLTNEEVVEAALEKKEQRRAFALPFRKDDRYVPLTATEKAIRDALVSHAVVLLHGAPGKGKSTLARAMALEYKEAPALFEDVFYLEFGRGLASTWNSAVQFKLLQHLGAPLRPEEETGSGSDFPNRLQRHLKDRKLLIILDDVWDGGILRGMLNLCGSGIKCLVTSQREDLCQGLACSSIHVRMEDVQLRDARKILAIHVQFSDHVIPPELKEITDKVIQEIERNPLALAIIGGSIGTRRSDELDTWEDVADDLFAKLDDDCVIYMNNMEYPISLWATMKRSFESLEKGAQSLLIFVGMCEELSVPEEVIKLLYLSTRVPGVSTDFAKLREELENREMVKIAIVSELEIGRKERSWSIHSLQKKFIDFVVKDAKESVFALLEGLSSTETGSPVESVLYPLEPQMDKDVSIGEEDLLICLAALYFDKQFKQRAAERAELKMGIPSDKFNNLRRSAIEPVIRLLGQPIRNPWTEQLRICAKRVFMGYISSDTLKDNDISDLLVSSISRLAMMTVLENIATLGGTTLLDDKLHNYMHVLIDLLDAEENTSNIREAAHRALLYLCENEAPRAFIATKLPRVVDTLMRLLLKDACPETLRAYSASTLARICLVEKGNVRERMVQYPGLLACLVELLSRQYSPRLRLNTSFLLLRLARGHNDIKLKLVDTGGLLEDLLKLFLKEAQSGLQKNVAATLALLAEAVGEVKVKTLEKLHEIPSTMDGLSRLLAEDVDPNIQHCAVRVLTSTYPIEGNAAHLYSGEAYQGRGYANLLSGSYEASLADLDKALEMQPKDAYALSFRCFVRAKLENYEGAFLDINKALEIECTPFGLQERGVLKCMMGDLPGALVDLNKGLEIGPDHYERLKYRGYVKFLMKDKVGASADAKWALQMKPPRVDDPGYGRSSLGQKSVEYMGYKLR